MKNASASTDFRAKSEYVRIAMEILSTTIYRHKLKASDVAVLATILGYVGTEPIRKAAKLPETADSIITAAMDLGRDAYKVLAQQMAVVPHPRDPKRKKGIFN